MVHPVSVIRNAAIKSTAAILAAIHQALGPGIHRGRGEPGPVTVYSVYRTRNLSLVRELIAQLPEGSSCHLHCLEDDVPAELTSYTRAHGPGPRMQLLQHLIDNHPPRPGDYLMIVDDDVTLDRSQLARFVALCQAGRLDIAQPAHSRRSIYSYSFNRVRGFVTARRVGYVEVGPLVLFSPAAQRLVLPFPAEARMGWGVDVAWTALRRQGLTLGIVDATPMTHHGAVAAGYSATAEWQQVYRRLADVGVTSMKELLTTEKPVWRPWQQLAPWLASATDASGQPRT